MKLLLIKVSQMFCLIPFGLLLTVSCSNNSQPTPIDDDNGNNRPEVTAPVPYLVEVGPDYYPFPHHAPTMNADQYQVLLDELFIINGFGNYQGSGDFESMYMHDGLDIVLNNGTDLFFITNGTVVKILDHLAGSKMLIVEDETNPNFGWAYVHIDNFDVQLGQKVWRGQYLGEVSFYGIEHIHLTRVAKHPSLTWSEGYLSVEPSHLFLFHDDEAPIIGSSVYSFMAGTDQIIAQNDSSPVFGSIDLVIPVRETGRYAESVETTGAKARWLPKVLTWNIQNEANEILLDRSFDFEHLYIDFDYNYDYLREQASIIIKPPQLFTGVPWYLEGFTYLMISRLPQIDAPRTLNDNDRLLHWDTQKLNSEGDAVYPNGRYKLTIQAIDTNGNTITQSMWIEVQN